jgi:hypothetical protein
MQNWPDHYSVSSHIIENGTVAPNPAKIQAVTDSPIPKTVKQVLSFLGLASYYRKYVKNFSTIAAPLIHLTKKGVQFIWTHIEKDSFDELKRRLTTAPLLVLPDFTRPFRVECDASNTGVGAVLSQRQDKDWLPVCYFSKHLNSAQTRYSTSEKELLAIVLAVEHYR